jgi:hypothetical protein
VGFARALGHTSGNLAELWALKEPFRKGFSVVLVEVDVEMVVMSLISLKKL